MLIDFHFHLTHDAFNIGLVMLEVNFTLCGFSNRRSEIRVVLLGHRLKLMLFTVLCPGSLTSNCSSVYFILSDGSFSNLNRNAQKVIMGDMEQNCWIPECFAVWH